jgi:hypothetical protein
VRREEFDETLRELCRVLRPGGVASHEVDLRDHLGGALNNLRFTERRWESRAFFRSGFYTNRIRFREMLRRFDRAGFAVALSEVWRWNGVPTPREGMAPEFRSLPADDLCVKGFTAILRPRPAVMAKAEMGRARCA